MSDQTHIHRHIRPKDLLFRVKNGTRVPIRLSLRTYAHEQQLEQKTALEIKAKSLKKILSQGQGRFELPHQICPGRGVLKERSEPVYHIV